MVIVEVIECTKALDVSRVNIFNDPWRDRMIINNFPAHFTAQPVFVLTSEKIESEES